MLICNSNPVFPGLKILYRDPPRGYRHPDITPSLSLPLSEQRKSAHKGLFQQKSADSLATCVAPRTKYWSEGHSNKIHAVSLDPVKSKSLSWKQDECVQSPSHVLDRGLTPTHSTPVHRRRSLSETRSYDVASLSGQRETEIRRVSRKSSKSADNLTQMAAFFRHSPARRSFSGRSSSHHYPEQRERAFTDVLPGGRKRSYTKPSPSHVDGRREARKVWKTSSDFDHDRSSGSISFTLSPTMLRYEGEELEYHSKEHNFSVKIPKAALKKRGTVEIQVGLAIHGPFTFPENTRNVSPILWLCAIPESKFRKPIQVTLPHCILDGRPGSLKRRRTDENLSLLFASANLKSSSSSSSSSGKNCGKRNFDFDQAEGEDFVFSSTQDSLSCSFSTKHLSPLCIVASCGRMLDVVREIASHAVYCVVPVVPVVPVGMREWNVHFCLTFNLPTCVQVYYISHTHTNIALY